MLQEMEANNNAEQTPAAAEESKQAQTSEVGSEANEGAEEGAQSSSQYTAHEQEAMQKGWKPRDQYEGEDWRPAREFLERGELLDKIHNLNREVKSHKETLKNVETLMKRREEFAAKRAIESLKQQRIEAIQNGDVEAVEKIDVDLQEAKKEIEPPKQAEIPEQMRDWQSRNKEWFNFDTPENIRMVEEARKTEELIMRYKKVDPVEALEMVEKEIKRQFPHRFSKSPRPNIPEVEGNTPGNGVKKAKFDSKQVTDDMRKVARDFVRKGVFKSESEYYESFLGVK